MIAAESLAQEFQGVRSSAGAERSGHGFYKGKNLSIFNITGERDFNAP
jgi:hypothetical protein